MLRVTTVLGDPELLSLLMTLQAENVRRVITVMDLETKLPVLSELTILMKECLLAYLVHLDTFVMILP